MGKDTPLISVIVPVYGVERYLRQCIDSVLAQTFANWEMILVDDGSPDRCGEICDEYAAADSRICVIHSKNGGMSVARNRGLDIAMGKFVTFIDSDDMVHPQYLEVLYDGAVRNNCEISSIDFRVSTGQSPNIPKKSEYKIEVEGSIDFLSDMLYQKRGNNAVWGRLYRRELFDRERFIPGIGYEDLDIIYRLLIRVSRIAYGVDALYYYRVNPKSYIGSFNSKRSDVLDVSDRMVEKITGLCPELSMAARSRRLSAHFNIYLLLAASGIRNEALEKRCSDLIRRERKIFLFNPNIRLKNRLGIIASYLLGMKGLRSVGRFLVSFNAR